MWKFLTLAFAGATMLLSTATMAHAQTSKRMINVLVIADDQNMDNIPLSSNINNRVETELREQLAPFGYRIMSLEGMMARVGWMNGMDDRTTRLDKIAMAQAGCSNGDITTCPRLIVFVQTRAGVTRVGSGALAQVRLQGDIIDTQNATHLASFQPVRDKFTAPWPCNDFCIDEVVGDHAYDISSELGDVLRIKLDMAMQTLEPGYLSHGDRGTDQALLATDYIITFRNFSMSDIRAILDIMDTQFGGDGELGNSEARLPVWKQNYRSNHNTTEMTMLFYQLLEDMGYGEDEVRVTATDGRIFEINKLIRD